MSRCRSCAAQVVWCVTTHGKRIPVDAEPVVDGNLFSVSGPLVEGARVEVDGGPNLLDSTERVRFVSHFVTCPDARSHRRQ